MNKTLIKIVAAITAANICCVPVLASTVQPTPRTALQRTQLSFNGGKITDAVCQTAYYFNLAALSSKENTKFTIKSGSLPKGLYITSEGVISGLPTVIGTSNLEITATEGDTSVTSTISISVVAIKIPTASIPVNSISGSDLTITFNGSTAAAYVNNISEITYDGTKLAKDKFKVGDCAITIPKEFITTAGVDLAIQFKCEAAETTELNKTVTILAATAPEITVNSEQTDWTNQDIKLNLTYSAGKGSSLSALNKKYSINNNELISAPESGEILLTNDGIYYINAEVTDNNYSQTPVTKKFGPYKIDKTAPSIISADIKNRTSESFEISVSANDSGVGIASANAYAFSQSDTEPEAPVWQNSNTFVVNTDVNTAVKVWYKVCDALGNQTKWEQITGRTFSNKSDITNFSIPNQLGATSIENNIIVVKMPYGTDCTALTPNISTADSAIIYPNPSEQRDFTTEQIYKVTAEDGTEQEYTVIVETASLKELKILTAPETIVAGQTYHVTAAVYDELGNVATGYTDNLELSTTDEKTVSDDIKLIPTENDGVFSFDIIFKTSGNQVVTIKDKDIEELAAVSQTSVINGTVNSFGISGIPDTINTKTPFTITVKAYDEFDNFVPDYNGSVTFTSTDTSAVLPTDAKLVNGIGEFEVTYSSEAENTIKVADFNNENIFGLSDPTFSSHAKSGKTVSIVSINKNGQLVNPTIFNLSQKSGTLEVSPKSNFSNVFVTIPLSIISRMRSTNPDFIIKISTPYGICDVPVNFIDYIVEYKNITNAGVRFNFSDATKNGVKATNFSMDLVNYNTGAAAKSNISLNKPIDFQMKIQNYSKNLYGFVMGSDNGLSFISNTKNENYLTLKVKGGNTYALSEKSVAFSDVSNSHWANEYITRAASRGLIQGVGNNSFESERQVTRAEFVQMMINILQVQSATSLPQYNDVNIGDWHYPAITKAYSVGLLTKFTGSQFAPNQPISREEMAYILAGTAKLINISNRFDYIDLSQRFDDYSTASSKYDNDIQYVYQAGLMEGKTGSTFEPAELTTRAEAATVQIRLLEKLSMID